MRPVNIKKLNYKDELAYRHRRAFILKIVVIAAGTVAVVAGIIYLLFFSRLFDIREVSFNGLDTVGSDIFRAKIDENLNQKILKFLPRRDNIFFVNTGNFEKEFTSVYPVFRSVNIQRKLFHGLVLNFLERKPVGVWCFNTLTGASCSYFDNDKALWGQPAKSSGFIFLTVDDQRMVRPGSPQETDLKINDEFFKPIMEVAKSMSGEINNIVIPVDSFNEFRVYTSDYYIIFATDSDIQNQLDILKIFLNDKKGDPNFHPQYIDLRIDGRVYHK
jgi:hypothetical protein